MQNLVNEGFHTEFIGLREQMQTQQKLLVALGRKVEASEDEIRQLKVKN